ncbi:MAG: LiaF domain-containing protein [Vicinamibacteria bacterium]
MSPSCERNPTGRLFLGLAVMLFGLALALDNFGLFRLRFLVDFWPVVVIAIGATRLARSARRGGPPDGLVMTCVGVLLLLMTLDVLRFKQAFALFLFALGGAMVLRAVRRGPGNETGTVGTERLDAFALLGGVQRVSRSADFRGGNASATLGGCEIDLRQASILDGETAVLDAMTFMGGVEVRVPEDWTVETRGIAVLGAFEDKTRRPLDDRKKLVVTGFAVMGGVEVKN